MTASHTVMQASSERPLGLLVYLEPPRPQYARQRSNSLPAGLANMNAQEADMLFSAAERATERRRRPLSSHTPYRIDHSRARQAPSHIRFDSATTIRPSPPPKDTPKREQTSFAPSVKDMKKQTKARALRNLDVNQSLNRKSSTATAKKSKSKPSLPQPLPLPLPVLSPAKRLVTSPSLKTYADGLFQFTQTRLVSAIPNVLSPPPSATCDVFVDDASQLQMERSPSRPAFESKFSDWSVNTVESRQSVVHQSMLTRQTLDTDPSLMSPDSFFGGFEDTPRRPDFSIRTALSGYPSSEAYGEHQPPTPPSCMAEPLVSPMEEFSYFTNYDQYIDVQDTKADIDSATQALETLAIELSPTKSHAYNISSPPQLRRANSSLDPPMLSRSCSSITPSYKLAASTPVTPYQKAQLEQAHVAVRIPHWLIGAIG